MRRISPLVGETPEETRRRHKRESSWGRIIQHIEGSGTFAAISAYRGELSQKENRERHNELRRDIRSMGYGYIEMDAGYTYQSQRGKEVQALEESFFIPGIKKEDAPYLGQKYDQESIIWKDPTQFAVIFSDTGAVDMEFQMERGGNGQITFDPETLKMAFSRLHKGSDVQRRQSFAFRAESVSESFTIRAIAAPTRSEIYRAQREKVYAKAEPISLNQYLREVGAGLQRKRSKQERKRIGTVAFWAKGEEVIETDEAHIRVIMQDPEKFGLTAEEIDEIHDEYGERRGQEGKARNELIKRVARNGWVRVRHYVNKGSDYWSIQVDRYRKRRDSIDNFIWWALESDIMKMNDELVITAYDENMVLQYSFMDGGVKAYLEETDHSKHVHPLFETLADDQSLLEE